ncbi:hypothetical protein G6F31_021940 [Rhizopus arrhizus]|nr:hypothetical protein G6F31_021940 [Rhizopus arrhizus]
MQTPYGVFPRDLPVFAGGWSTPRACEASCTNHHVPVGGGRRAADPLAARMQAGARRGRVQWRRRWRQPGVRSIGPVRRWK